MADFFFTDNHKNTNQSELDIDPSVCFTVSTNKAFLISHISLMSNIHNLHGDR